MPDIQDPHHEKFVKDFRKLLINAGFLKEEVVKQGNTEEGPDIIININCRNLKLKVIIQCRSANSPNTLYSNLGNDIRTYDSLRREFHADRAMLVLENYDIPDKYKEKSKIEEILKNKKVIYWDQQVIEYYRQSVRTLGKPFSKFFILKDIGISIQLRKKPFKVKAFSLKQNKKSENLWIFLMEPKKLLQLTYVFRRGSKDPEAYQRMLSYSKLTDIGEFLSNKDSMIANNILVAFEDKNIEYSRGVLSIPAKTCSLWIIDGQHRLYGFLKLSEKLDKEEREKILKNYKLIVSGIKIKPRLQGRLFTDINSTQRRIDRNLLLDLFDYLDIEAEEGILKRIRIAKRLRKIDAFKNRIKILDTDDGTITLATIVDYKQFNDIINHFKNNSYRILSDFFKSVRDVFTSEWENSEEYVFSNNKGIRMLLSLLVKIKDYCRSKNQDLKYDTIKPIIEKLKDSTLSEPDYFKTVSYIGQALGAGSPDIVSRDIWATRIDEQLGDFLSETERNNIMLDSKRILEKLENKLRDIIENRLSSELNWWKQKIPSDVITNAEERKRKGEKVWPWYRSTETSNLAYVDFTDYEKIILRKNNWDVFKDVFKDPIITSAKLKELDPIRKDIAHNRKLIPEKMEHLRLYSRDIICCIDNALNTTQDQVLANPQENTS